MTLAFAALIGVCACAGANAHGGEKAESGDRGKQVVTNSIGMKLVLVPSGEFMMGNPHRPDEERKFLGPETDSLVEDCFDDEYPPHPVRITRAFYLGVYSVTVGQFRRFVAETEYGTDAETGGTTGPDNWWRGAYDWGGPWADNYRLHRDYSWRKTGFRQGEDHPVVNVSWNDAVAFCRWLSAQEHKAYRLPTEAEWEYACRAGSTTRYYCGDDPTELVKVGNVADAASKKEIPGWEFVVHGSDGYVFTAPAGRFRPNGFGLYDMHGNAAQWCSDWYRPDYYAQSPRDDPQGPKDPYGTDSSGSELRVTRGSGWCAGAAECRSSNRSSSLAADRNYALGFRVARDK